MGVGPVHLGDDRWALWSSFVDDWASSPGTREEIAETLILSAIESAVDQADRTIQRAVDHPRRGYTAKELIEEHGQPPTDEEVDAQDGGEEIPAEVVSALRVLMQWSRDYYASVGARLFGEDSEPQEPATEADEPTSGYTEASDAKSCLHPTCVDMDICPH